jgi:threonine dehydrogenase-like Zn-dependent dehydrogenase
MRALYWHGKGDVRVDTVADPQIENPRDAIIKITACAICGSDLHLLDDYQPTMEAGDILGHENMGEVVALGAEFTDLKIGDRVVVPFTISCGGCWFCQLRMCRSNRAIPSPYGAAARWGSLRSARNRCEPPT